MIKSISNDRLFCQRSRVKVSCVSDSNRWFVYAYLRNGSFLNVGIVDGCGRIDPPSAKVVNRVLIDYLLESLDYNPSDIACVRCSRNVHYRHVVEFK